MSFMSILSLALKLFGIWMDVRKSQADKRQSMIDALKAAQTGIPLTTKIHDAVTDMREEIEKGKQNE